MNSGPGAIIDTHGVNVIIRIQQLKPSDKAHIHYDTH